MIASALVHGSACSACSADSMCFFSTCEALGSWVMGHAEAPTSSSWAPTAFGRSRCGGAVGLGSLGSLGGPGEPWGPGTDAEGLTVAFLSGKYTEKSYRQVSTQK